MAHSSPGYQTLDNLRDNLPDELKSYRNTIFPLFIALAISMAMHMLSQGSPVINVDKKATSTLKLM